MGSLTMIRAAPAARAISTCSSPMGPAPMMNSESPMPVRHNSSDAVTQAAGSVSAARSSGRSSGTVKTCPRPTMAAGTSSDSAKPPSMS